jgi:hypothetical protein
MFAVIPANAGIQKVARRATGVSLIPQNEFLSVSL